MRLIDADALVHDVMTEWGFDPHYMIIDDIDGIKAMADSLILERINLQPTVHPWHMVEEPPKKNGAFAVACVYDGKLYWYKGIYLDGKWLREGDGMEMPADYWMAIPEPPKEDNERL